eukprot:Amastigsp_a677158_276.p5 type:complete len:147 gc:universal Amastigsp_a677158_276:852-1292(+)
MLRRAHCARCGSCATCPCTDPGARPGALGVCPRSLSGAHDDGRRSRRRRGQRYRQSHRRRRRRPCPGGPQGHVRRRSPASRRPAECPKQPRSPASSLRLPRFQDCGQGGTSSPASCTICGCRRSTQRGRPRAGHKVHDGRSSTNAL